MGYRNPRFSWLHALADAGYTNVSYNGSLAANSEEHYLFDYRVSSLFIWSSAATDRWIKLDRTAAGLEIIDRMVIPAGHNLDGAAFKLQHSTTGAYGGEETDALDTSFSGTGVQSFDTFSGGGSTNRYWRLIISTSGAWEIPQLYLTRTRTTGSTGRGPDPGWSQRPRSVGVRRQLPTRSVGSIFSPNRLAVSLTHNKLEGAELTLFEDLFEGVGVNLLPFWYDPMDDTKDPRYMMIVGNEPRALQQRVAPKTYGEAHQFGFDMLEQID